MSERDLDQFRDETGPPEPAEPTDRPRELVRPAVIGALLVGLGLWLVLALLPSFLAEPGTQPDAPIAPDTTGARRIQATLFYVSDDGAALVQVVREVPFGATPAEQARHIVEAQVLPPPDGYASAIPAGAKVRSVFLGAHGEAYVDLGPEVATGHGGGSSGEALAVFAIVNAITSNLPDVSAVQILVDGKEVDSLAGHIDLRQPIRRAGDWIRKGQ